jgi:hypothetical protein
MKLVFRKYMEFEQEHGTKAKMEDLKKRVEEYLQKVFKQDSGESESD